MASISRFNAAYDIVQDRIQLQVVGSDWNQNFWITRRSLILIKNVFLNLLEKHYKQQAQQSTGDATYANDFATFGREASLASNPVSPTKSLEQPATPPILLYKISFKDLGDGQFTLELSDVNNRGHGYQLAENMLHVLLELLQSQADKAEWGIQVTATSPPSHQRATHPPSRTLN